MKIAHVVNTTAPGGAEKQLEELVRRSAFDHEVILLGGSGAHARLDVACELRASLVKLRPDVVVAWLERPQLALTAVRPRMATVAAVRGLPRRVGVDALAVRAALSRYDYLIANSDASRAATRRFLGRLRVPPFEVIPNGVDPTADTRKASETYRIGFIGRDDHAKGLDVLLAAVPRLPQDVEVVLVGAGVPAAAERAGLDARCIAHDRTRDPWRAAGPLDLLVVPSRSEGSPNIILEAFVRRVPVVGADAGGITELLRHGRGVIVIPDDVTALTDAIDAMRHDAAGAHSRAETAHRYVLHAHAWPRVVAAWDNLFIRAAG